MSSSPPTRWSSRAVLLVVLLVLSALLVLPALLAAPGAAAQPSLVAVPAGTADGQVRLVVQVPGGPVPPDAIGASVNGESQDAHAEPVLSGRLATALVVDASADGAPMLPVGLAGGANLVLAAPPTTRTTLVTDTTPPAVALPWPSGPADTLRALSDVRAGGARSTAAALDLAVAQLRAGATDPRLVVLYTGAPDAGDEPAATVVERMRAAGVVLAVVGSGETASPFWTAVAEGTGGMAVTAGPSGVIGAFDQVTAALGSRYLLTFPAPARLPATVAVQVDTAGGPVSTEATVTPAALPPGSGGTGPVVAVAIGGMIAVVLVAGAVVLVRRRAGGRRNGAVVGPVWSIPPLPGDLVDRATVREEVTAAVQRGGPVWLRPHPDVEGLGTTTAMLDFAHRNRDRYDIAWWVPARDADLVPDRLAELAEALDLATATDSAERSATALLEALSRRNRWLLVFDDAAGPRQLARYLPDGPGHVLISSSDAGWQEQACPVTVSAFTRAESESLLRSRCPDLSAEAADRIAARLDDLPLAVGPVAAVLADPDTDADAVLDALPGAPAPWEAVWDLARDRLADADPAALALLTLAAWLGPAPVPLALLTDHPDVLPEPLAARTPALADHAALLDRRGLARVTDDDLLLHPMVAGLLTDRTAAEHAAVGGWAAIAVRLLAAAAPERPARDRSTWPTWRWLLPHVVAATDPARRLETVAAEVGMLLGAAGTYLAARGRSHSARALLDDAHEFDVVARLRTAGEAVTEQPASEQADTR
jgi:hypothetical protein